MKSLPVRVYVAGPITHGDTLRNVHRAEEMGRDLFLAGFAPFVPHFDKGLLLPENEETYEKLLRWDFAWISVSDAVLRLPGYSPGADRELQFAASLGLPIFYHFKELVAHFEELGRIEAVG